MIAKRSREAGPIQAGQPFDARCDAPLAHGLPAGHTKRVNALIAKARRMALSKGHRPASKGTAVVYLLRLRSGTLKIGATTDLEKRLADHLSGNACRTTQLDPPTFLLRTEVCATFTEARRREAQLKRWSRAKKESIAAGDLAALRNLSKSRD
ncbi:MAG TPA: GIY-YIG nuclease family protein [Opitutaceae bacterium]|nr:GIY-YIG nuclease family protein [Opitutaceae bacterium]